MIEYKVRQVTRYIVTRWEGSSTHLLLPNGLADSLHVQAGKQIGSKSSQHGEYDNGELAYAVAYALAKTEADKLGYEPGDDRIQFPELPKGATGEGVRY